MDESTAFQTNLHALVNGLVDQQAMPDDWWQDAAAQVYDQANEMADALRLALEKIAPCVVGWDSVDSMPVFAQELWKVVNPIQRVLGIAETDIHGHHLGSVNA